MKERLGWTDTDLLKALRVLVETQSWQRKGPDAKEDEKMTETQAAVQYITSALCTSLESKEECVSAIQIELEVAVEYARVTFLLTPKAIERFDISLIPAWMQVRGLIFFIL